MNELLIIIIGGIVVTIIVSWLGIGGQRKLLCRVLQLKRQENG